MYINSDRHVKDLPSVEHYVAKWYLLLLGRSEGLAD